MPAQVLDAAMRLILATKSHTPLAQDVDDQVSMSEPD
jgi:hypothetical protein